MLGLEWEILKHLRPSMYLNHICRMDFTSWVRKIVTKLSVSDCRDDDDDGSNDNDLTVDRLHQGLHSLVLKNSTYPQFNQVQSPQLNSISRLNSSPLMTHRRDTTKI